jgi:MFS family permease
MNAGEIRAVASLAFVYALRMLGMFMVLPVLALYAQALPGGATALQIGLAIGLYGLAQAALQVPLGWLSDRVGRKPVIVAGMLLFALGSLIAGLSEGIEGVLLGRCIQGLGAVSSAVSALLADVTREQVRTTAMAVMGVGMGGAFILALVLGPVVAGLIGVDGIFLMTAVLALSSIPLVLWWVPRAPVQPAQPGGMALAFASPELLRLDAGIFLLHACMTALFVALPFALTETLALDSAAHWQIYLPVLLLSVLPVFPLIRWAERSGRAKPVFVAAVALLAVALLAAGALHDDAPGLVLALLAYFVAFNYLEGALPSLISRQAPPQHKGAALGVYASGQFLGGFTGGLLGGIALGLFGVGGALAVAGLLPIIWLSFAIRLNPPAAAAHRPTH